MRTRKRTLGAAKQKKEGNELPYEQRYQFFGPNGITWTNWFPCNDKLINEEWQLKNKLKNEFRKRV